MESSCYLVSRLLVTLVALCLVPWCSAQTCIATGENSACTESRSCRHEYPMQENVCLPAIHPRSFGNCNLCPMASVFSGEAPDIPPVVHLYSLNWEYFTLNISWNSNNSTGAKVVIRQIGEGFIEIMDCLCLTPSSQGYTYTNAFQYDFNRGGGTIVVEVHWRDDPRLPDDQKMVSTELDYPSSCLDIEHEPSTCGSPVYEAPTNVSICIHVSTDQNSTLDISWDYRTDYVYPSAFYITLYTFDVSFKVENTTSVRITIPVESNSINIFMRITPFYRCSGIANGTYRGFSYISCGLPDYQDTQVLPCPTMPTSTALPSTVAMMPVSESTVAVTPTTDPVLSTLPIAPGTGVPAPSQNLIIGISVACGTAVTILLALSVAMFVTVYRCRRRPKPDWTSPNQPTFDREHSVFVAYVPHDAAEEAIQTCVVAPLLHQCHFMVVTAGRKVRGNMVEWIEEQESKATAVLFVVTEDFQCAWDSTLSKSQFIEAVRRLITSSVAQGRLEDKYAIVVLDESSKRFIPANNYLRNLNTYVLGDQVQDVYNFVTKSKMFQHRNHRESSDSSLASSVGSSGVKSVCTVSMDLDSDSLGSHEDVPTSVSHSDPGLEELHAILTPNCDSVSNCDSV